MSTQPDATTEPNGLPDGWDEAPLGDIATLLSGSTPSSNVPAYWGGDVVWITPSDLSDLDTALIQTSERRLTDAGRAAASLPAVPKGAVVISSRAPIGHIGVADVDLTLNQGCKALVFGADHDSMFHYYNLSFRMDRIRARGEGTTFQEISRGELAKVSMPYLLDPEEQAGVARTLRLADEAIDRTRALLAKRRRLHKGLVRSLLKLGIDERGHIRDFETHDFRPSRLGLVPTSWEVEGLASRGHPTRPHLKTGPFGSSLKHHDWVQTGVPVVTIGSLGEGAFVMSELFYISDQKAESLAPYVLTAGDIVFSRVADVGRSVVVGENHTGWVMSSNMMRISLDPSRTIPDYVRLNIVAHPGIRLQIRQLVNTGGRDVANQEVLNALRFPWPSYDEQRHILDAVAASEDVIKTTRGEIDKLTRLKSGLMQALLTGHVRVAPDPAAP